MKTKLRDYRDRELSIQLAARFPPHIESKIRERCEKYMISVSEFIRRAVLNELKKRAR